MKKIMIITFNSKEFLKLVRFEKKFRMFTVALISFPSNEVNLKAISLIHFVKCVWES